MATQKPKAATKAKPAVKNTSAAAAPGNSADVSAAEAVKAASPAIAPQAGQTSSDEAKGIPPAGAAPGNGADVSAAEMVKAASPAIAPQAGQTSSDESKGIPPAGTKKDKEPVAKALVVSAKADGFRRAGRRWTVAAQTVDIDDFSPEQVEALLAEPMLDVVVVAESAGDTVPGAAGNI